MTTSSYSSFRRPRGYAGSIENGTERSKLRQDWAVGQTVNVGFVKGLYVTAKDAQGWYSLINAKGVEYFFLPHGGLVRADTCCA